MVHMCKRIISLGVILHYVSASTPYLSKHTSYDRVFLLHNFEMMTSADVGLIFKKFWLCKLLRGEGFKRAKNGQK